MGGRYTSTAVSRCNPWPLDTCPISSSPGVSSPEHATDITRHTPAKNSPRSSTSRDQPHSRSSVGSVLSLSIRWRVPHSPHEPAPGGPPGPSRRRSTPSSLLFFAGPGAEPKFASSSHQAMMSSRQNPEAVRRPAWDVCRRTSSRVGDNIPGTIRPVTREARCPDRSPAAPSRTSRIDVPVPPRHTAGTLPLRPSGDTR